METPNLRRRAVLIVSRNDVIPVVNNVVVAPVTSTIRDIATCIAVGVEEGLDHDGTMCVAAVIDTGLAVGPEGDARPASAMTSPWCRRLVRSMSRTRTSADCAAVSASGRSATMATGCDHRSSRVWAEELGLQLPR